MSTLAAKRVQPESGSPDSLVIFLHGYGANGKDLLGIADAIKETLPNTLFVAPDAPQACAINPEGYQWFSIPAYDNSTAVDLGRTLQESLTKLNKFVDEEIAASGVSYSRTILFGFSQGTMLALEYAPTCRHEFAGIVGCSGRLLNSESLEGKTISRPPVLLMHDKDDEVVPFESLDEARNQLIQNAFRVYTYESKGLGHSISPIGLGVAVHFIARELDRQQSP